MRFGRLNDLYDTMFFVGQLIDDARVMGVMGTRPLALATGQECWTAGQLVCSGAAPADASPSRRRAGGASASPQDDMPARSSLPTLGGGDHAARREHGRRAHARTARLSLATARGAAAVDDALLRVASLECRDSPRRPLPRVLVSLLPRMRTGAGMSASLVGRSERVGSRSAVCYVGQGTREHLDKLLVKLGDIEAGRHVWDNLRTSDAGAR